jgi:hypothetical protein
MIRLRTFLLSMNVLNGLLMLAIAAAVYFAVIPFLYPTVRISLPPVKATVGRVEAKATLAQNSSPADYAVISDQNLFHPERKMPPEKQPEVLIPKPDLFLYGTLITNETSFAFVEDKKAPYSTTGRGKRQLTLKKGDNLSGYILSEIEANRIVLVKGDDKLVVTLDDRAKKRTVETSSSPATAQTMPGGMTPFPTAASTFPQGASSSAQAAPSPGPGLGVPASRPPSAQIAPPPGQEMGVPGLRPPTRRGLIQEVQEIKAARQMSP